jgi:sedoheptulokinase
MIVAIDIGTSKLCVLAWDPAEGRVRAVRSAPNAATLPGLPSGRHEQDPARVAADVKGLLREVLGDPAMEPGAVEAVAITGQVHGALLVAPDGEPLTAFPTWRDQRTAGAVEAANAGDPDGPARTGCRLHAGYGALLLAEWAQQGAIPERARAVSMLDFVAASLCGVIATETTHASSWGLLDLRRMAWDDARLDRLGIPRGVLPPLRPSGRPLGRVTQQACTELGLPATAVVGSPIGDNQASVVGAAGFETDVCVLNLGTGGQISVVRRDYAFDPALETRPMPGRGFLQVGASLCGGESYAILCRFYRDLVREIGGLELPLSEVYARMNDLAAQSDAAAGGLVADTRFAGARTEPSARGALAGLGIDNLTAGGVARAVIEGMVRELADMIRRPGMPDLRCVFAGGNGVRRNPVAQEAVRRQFGVPCVMGPEREEAAIGAAQCVARLFAETGC